MEVQVNHQIHQTEEGETLKHLLARLGFSEPKGIAIAINNVVVPKTNWNNYSLQPKDQITIIRATQGG